MKYLDEYRDPRAVRACAAAIRSAVRGRWTIMEVCGGQTHAIVKHGLDELLPPQITLIHGPGCPVCVTDAAILDKAHQIAARPEVIFCTFGDMLRVPGTRTDLFQVKAAGADVRVVYSPLEAVEIAALSPGREVVFFAVGFETTAPANAMSVHQARQRGLTNFSLLVSHVLVPPAIEAILRAPGSRVQAFLAAGHVCAIMGTREYEPLASRYNVPIVVTGFEPLDIMQGVLMCVRQLESGRHEVENQYARAVRSEGNRQAQDLISRVFSVQPRHWRGMGSIEASGFGLSDQFRAFDALERFGPLETPGRESGECISGLIMQGLKKPADCPAFGLRCTPETPLGATMVSNEGACSAYYRYRT